MPLLHFGPFTVDYRSATLSRGGGLVPLSPRLVQVLTCLAEARGALVTRELLLERFWPDVTVADNTLTRAVADIRKALDDDPRTPRFIQTMARRGYRFLADVTEEAEAPAGPGAGPVTPTFAGLEPFVAWERGRLALESLAVRELPVAVEAFSRAVAGAGHYAPAYAGLANAHIFRFEATRVDDEPAAAALTEAIAAATRATTLDPAMGEGWAALGHAFAAAGRMDEARAALRQATALEPRNWRHQYRLAVATWGEERLRAVERAEALLPGFPGTRTLAVTVHVARQAFDLATAAAERGAAAQDAQQDHGRYPANGLRWLRGLTRVAAGRLDDALADFTAEATTSGAASTVYARECLVLAREGAGFTRVALGHGDAARGDFLAAAEASPDHARALLGLAVSGGDAALAADRVADACARLDRSGKTTERALVTAAAHAWAGRAADGLALLDAALAPGSPEPAGWSLPADPMFLPLRSADGYARLAARLAARAA